MQGNDSAYKSTDLKAWQPEFAIQNLHKRRLGKNQLHKDLLWPPWGTPWNEHTHTYTRARACNPSTKQSINEPVSIGTRENNMHVPHKHQVLLRSLTSHQPFLSAALPLLALSAAPRSSQAPGAPWMLFALLPLALHPRASGMKVRHLLSIFPHCLAETGRPRFPTHKSLLIWTMLGHAALFTQ